MLQSKRWSFSSVKLFETCPYAFYLKYIEGIEDKDNAFNLHGSFVHKLLEDYFRGNLMAFELADKFEEEYDQYVTEKFPFATMFKAYYDKTLSYLQNFDGIKGEVLGVEKQLTATIGGYKFIGFADLIMRDKKGIFIVDHKSHGAWRSKSERSDYFRQLYLYAYCVEQMYGELPYKVVFNRFRMPDNPLDEELFNTTDYTASLEWFVESVSKILQVEDWECKINGFYCDNLCGCREECIWSDGI